MMEEDKSREHETSVKYQFIATVAVNLSTLTYGLSSGWSGPHVPILTSDETPLPSGKISMTEASWISSISCIGGTIGTIIFGWITNRFGRKIPLLFLTVPIIISWSLVLFASNVYFLYVARFMHGLVGGGIFVVVPLYVSEIANDCVRGFLGSITILSTNLGILLVFITGCYCDYFTTPKFSIILAALYVILFIMFPDTPLVLIKQNKLTEAENSIKFYQNLHDNKQCQELIQLEMNKLKKIICADESKEDDTFSWSDFVMNPGRKALIITLGAIILSQLCGVPALLAYTTSIFEESGVNDAAIATVVVGAIQFLGAFTATNLVDRAGRKFLYTTSAIGTGLSFCVLATYMMFKSFGCGVEPYNWIPLLSFSSISFVAACGISSLPFLVISEVLPEKIKNFGATLCSTTIWFFGFPVIKFLPLLNESIGFDGSMFLFAGVCLFGALIIILFLPETKGKSYEQIMEMLQ